MRRTTVYIDDRHKDWIDENHINLSSWVREQIDKEIQE